MYYMRRDGIRVYPRLWWLPILLLWWTVAGVVWVSVWTALWCWEACGPAGVRAARTTKRLLGWPG